jgi:hypothetical protein
LLEEEAGVEAVKDGVEDEVAGVAELVAVLCAVDAVEVLLRASARV